MAEVSSPHGGRADRTRAATHNQTATHNIILLAYIIYMFGIYDVCVWLPLGGRWTRCCHYVFMCFLPSFLRSRGGAVTRITESSFRRPLPQPKRYMIMLGAWLHATAEGRVRIYPYRWVREPEHR